MTTAGQNDWIDLGIPALEFRAASSLETGQCFHWKRIAVDEWLGIVCGCCVQLRSVPDTTLVKPLAGQLDLQAFLKYLNYGQGNPSLLDLQAVWGEGAAEAVRALPGARVLQQDPAEALISFICSANNNVPRISLMLEKMRQHAGGPLCKLPPSMAARMAEAYKDKEVPSHVHELLLRKSLCSFPSAEALASLGEAKLVELGLGYRARYVAATARDLVSTDLRALRSLPREDAERELRRFAGVGPKVAACVALYGLGFSGAVPVDVHVARAARHMAPHLASRITTSLTPRLHLEVADFFRDRFGSHAGWAQHVIFAAQRHHGRIPKSFLLFCQFVPWPREGSLCARTHYTKPPPARTIYAGVDGPSSPQNLTKWQGSCPVFCVSVLEPKLPTVAEDPVSAHGPPSPKGAWHEHLHWVWEDLLAGTLLCRTGARQQQARN